MSNTYIGWYSRKNKKTDDDSQNGQQGQMAGIAAPPSPLDNQGKGTQQQANSAPTISALAGTATAQNEN